jgi:hypothetical protein
MQAPENITIIKNGSVVEQFYRTAVGNYMRYYPIKSGDTPQTEKVMLDRCLYAKEGGYTVIKH